MSGVIISSSMVLSSSASGGGVINGDNPLIGYRNIVADGNISATSENVDYPVVNLANPSTYLRWIAEVSSPPVDQYITVLTGTLEDIDYLAIARHNFGSGQMPVSVEGLAVAGSPEDWVELISDVLLPDDGPVLFRFTPQSLTAIRLRIQPSQALVPLTPTVAVMYVGLLLVLQRRIYVPHTPITYGRKLTVASHRSIAGAFLGRIVLSEKNGTNVDLQNLTPSWYRENFEPFLIAAKEIPFFFAWRPASYPFEIGYAWLTDDPQPKNQRSNGMMQITMNIEGVV